MHVDHGGHHSAPDLASAPAAPPAPPELHASRSPSAPVVAQARAPSAVATARPPDPVSVTTSAKTGRTPLPQPPQGPDPGRTATAVRAALLPGPAPAAHVDAGETRRDVKPPPVSAATATRPISAPAAVPVPTKPTGGKRRSRGKASRAHKPPQIVPPPVVVAAPTPTPTPPPAVQSATALPVAVKTTTTTTTPVAAMTREQPQQTRAPNAAPDRAAQSVPDSRQALEPRTPLAEVPPVALPSEPADAPAPT
ncbi:hypothetical protein AMAG_09590 [Allomyces macrogynus ATCC 38327]|uniref:Uncharacterized protein n=1 Tax=Allomyces macrogynus (strain ATCC 38327) TaxID=578462 RepID=A0A0L0SSY9_ALLM3|nr:hypothetical protein AMAG_09590 [Allomyces macrogynus ATCC 38327]|eukprot:KNE65611.1 hypothetical protein AMAG_09590 [Allomyces macrogynus ATCC 38327]